MRKVALPWLMRRPGRTLALWPFLVIVATLAGACSPLGIGATRSPSPSAVASASRFPSPAPSAGASPAPATAPLGVLVSPFSGTNYTVSLVGIDGRVIASAQTTTPARVTCANGSAGVVPMPVSTSNTRAYFMDAQGVVRYLASNGDAGRATTLPIGPTRRSSFAVSPDDQRIAVVVIDVTPDGAATKLYVEDLNGGGHHLDTFNDSGAYTLWATGWHGPTNLVVAKVPACAQGGGPGCCGPLEYHVVDPATAIRRFTIGGPQCVIAGPPSPAGVVCEIKPFEVANVLDWTGKQTGGFPIGGPTFAALSPDGHLVAVVTGMTTAIFRTDIILNLAACGWIDDSHVIAGGDAQTQARLADVTTGKIIPVAAQGDCAGRIPGGL